MGCDRIGSAGVDGGATLMTTADVFMAIGDAAQTGLSWLLAIGFIVAGGAALVSIIREMGRDD